jgi:hypothetical protein
VSLALRRALAALGGAFGALPLLPPARGLAARLAGPPILPGAERLAGDIKAATWAELAVLIFVLPAAAFFFGRMLPAWIRRRGGFCVALPGLAMGSAFVLWRLGMRPRIALPAGLAAAAAVTALTILAPRLLGRRAVPEKEAPPSAPEEEDGARIGRAPAAAVLISITALSILIVEPTRGPAELFEEGQILTPAQEYVAGGAPYVDTYPVHGWGTDGGVDAVAARLFGPTLEVIRMRRWLWAVLGVPFLAIACWALFRRPPWSLAAFGLALSLCPYPSERQMPAFAGLAALVWAARSGRRRAWLVAGAVAACALFYALEYGAFLIAAAALTVATLGVLERSWLRAARAGVALASGVAIGSAPFVWSLARHGALMEFLRTSFRELPATISDVWGLPAGSAVPLAAKGDLLEAARALLFGEGLAWALHVSILGLAVAVVLWRASVPGLSRTDRAALAATWFAILAMRAALGRADYGHLVMHGVFVALPAAWLVFRASRAAHGKWLLAPAMALGLIVAVRPLGAARVAWKGLRSAAGDPECLRPLPGGRAILPCWQADEIGTLRAWMDGVLSPSETYFDFGNEPGLYFLLERRPPVRFPCAPFYEPEAAQREVIAALEREKPPVAILSSGAWPDTVDGIATHYRAPLVAAYLDEHYAAAERLGPRTLARRRHAP